MEQMFWTDIKLGQRIEEIAKYRYRDVHAIESFAAAEEVTGEITNPEIPAFDPDHTMKVGDLWSGRDRYLWLHTEAAIPQEWTGRRVLGLFDFGRTGEGNNSGFESMCYLNGKPYQGVDSNHQEVFLAEEYCGKSVSFVFRLWSGLEGGGIPTPQEHKIKNACLCWLDEKVDDFYYMGRLILETLDYLSEENPAVHDLRKALNDASLLIDWAYPGSEAFYESVHEADDYLNKKIDAMEKHSPINVGCVGHTHIDVAWLWRLKHTREKASRSFSTVLRLMELFPEYIFLQTQPQLYAYIKEDFPEIYEEIKKRAAEGRWEVDGAMWVEADCNLTSGESLTRQILLGSKFMKDEFGKDPEYLWLPDVFGYSWALPQILKKSGLNTFMTTKISWNQYNRMPHDTFMWKGMDGTEILTHFVTTPDPGSHHNKWFYTYNGFLTPKSVKGVWDAYIDKDLSKDLLISYGYGDGGGGVNRDMLECRRRIDRIPGLPNLKTSTAGEYFRKLHKNLEESDQYIHTWDGELYLEYHRGTYTSQAYNKRMNRKMELLYREAEWLTAMKAVADGNLSEAKQERLNDGWHQILTHQFHDIIPGSSIHDVYADSRKNYPVMESIANEVEEDFFAACTKQEENCYTVYNASSWTLDEQVVIDEAREGIFRDSNGNVLASQICGGKTAVAVKDVPSMGTSVIIFEPCEAPKTENGFAVTKAADTAAAGMDIETPFYSISLNEYGQISRLYDKEHDREVLPKGARANVLQMFEDKPMNFDAWDIDIYYQEKMREITNLKKCEVTECGPLRLVIRLEWDYMKSSFGQNMVLYSDNRRIDFVTDAEFAERQQLLKVAFPVDIRTTYATYDIQYGNVRRPNHWNTSWEMARFESVGHRFADLSERDYGVSLLNNCKYGYDVKGNVLRLSLLRSALQPDHLQDLGHHEFTYSLLPHKGDFVEGNTVRLAHELNQPLKVAAGKSTLSFDSFLAFDCPNIELDAVKKSEDGKYLVVRIHEYTGARAEVNLKTAFAYMGYCEGDLRERPTEEMQTGEVKLSLRPYEIRTILFSL